MRAPGTGSGASRRRHGNHPAADPIRSAPLRSAAPSPAAPLVRASRIAATLKAPPRRHHLPVLLLPAPANESEPGGRGRRCWIWGAATALGLGQKSGELERSSQLNSPRERLVAPGSPRSILLSRDAGAANQKSLPWAEGNERGALVSTLKPTLKAAAKYHKNTPEKLAAFEHSCCSMIVGHPPSQGTVAPFLQLPLSWHCPGVRPTQMFHGPCRHRTPCLPPPSLRCFPLPTTLLQLPQLTWFCTNEYAS